MAKVMLVEDDNNLREIYEARLLAEGYDIVSAQDGEEALALAVKEKPDLIIADIMMPKISGFDMLDILRSTPETRDTKVVMMTALSQAEDKDKANKLGADRYLVKSQVTLEDVARVAREVLDGKSPAEVDSSSATPSQPTPPAPDAGTPVPPPVDTSAVTPAPPVAAAPPVATPPAATPPSDPAASQPWAAPDPPIVPQPEPPSGSPAPPPSAAAENSAVLASAMQSVGGSNSSDQSGSSISAGEKTAVHTKVIEPINDMSKPQTSIQELVAKEEAKDAATNLPGAVGQPVINNMDGQPANPPANPADPNSISL